MLNSTRNEGTLLIARTGIPQVIRDRREFYEKKRAVYFILLTTLFERIAFYALMDTLFETLPRPQSFHWNLKHSQIASLIFSATSYLSTLIFAIISDAKIGKFRTIIIGFGLYLIGFTLMTVTASGNIPSCHFNETNHQNVTTIGSEKCASVILGTLVITGLGAGAVKSNLAVFGIEQTYSTNLKTRYFDKYAVAVNTGTLIAYSIIPYIQFAVLSDKYYVIYLIASISIAIATLLFLIGWKYYLDIRMNETVIANLFPVIFNACQIWYRFNRQDSIKTTNEHSHPSAERILSSSVSVISSDGDDLSQDDNDDNDDEQQPKTFLNYAKVPYGKYHDRIVDDVKSLRKAIYVFGILIVYWFIYNQTNSTFESQGKQMNRLENQEYIISWMKLGEPVTILIGILILNKFVYKHLEGRSREKIIVAKFIIGMTFAILAVCTTGIIEYIRLYKCQKSYPYLSIYFQILQYSLMGFSQLFAMIGGYEYSYYAAPFSAQSLFMSLHFCSIGLPAAIGTLFPIQFECQTSDKSYMSSIYFFILAGIQFVFIIIFSICQKKFHIVKLNRQQLETSQFM